MDDKSLSPRLFHRIFRLNWLFHPVFHWKLRICKVFYQSALTLFVNPILCRTPKTFKIIFFPEYYIYFILIYSVSMSFRKLLLQSHISGCNTAVFADTLQSTRSCKISENLVSVQRVHLSMTATHFWSKIY